MSLWLYDLVVSNCGCQTKGDTVHFMFLDAQGKRVVKTAAQPFQPFCYVLLSSMDQWLPLLATLQRFSTAFTPCMCPEMHGTSDLQMHVCKDPIHLLQKKRMDGHFVLTSPFARIRFPNLATLKSVTTQLVKEKFWPFERPTGPVWQERQIMDLGQFRCCNWIENASTNEWTHWRVDHSNALPAFKWIAADIETFSIGGQSVEPDPTRPTDPIFNVHVTLFSADKMIEKKGWAVSFSSLQSKESFGHVDFVVCERELLTQFARYVQASDAIALIFHNGNNFDVKYLFERALFTGHVTFPTLLSCIPCTPARYYKKIRTTAEGVRQWGLFDLPGLALLDSMECIRAEGHKLASYSLKETVWKFLSAVGTVSSIVQVDHSFLKIEMAKCTQGSLHSLLNSQNCMFRAVLPDGSIVEDQAFVEHDQIRLHWTCETPETIKQISFVDSKEGLSLADLWLSYETDDPAGLLKVAQYCQQDANLCGRLVAKLSSLPGLMSMCQLVSSPMRVLVISGQTIKILDRLTRFAHQRNTVVTPFGWQQLLQQERELLIANDERRQQGLPPLSKPPRPEKAKFKGATVIEPHLGVHLNPIAVGDFQSLYPSIMIAFNMCYTTLVLSEQDVPAGARVVWRNLTETEKVGFIQDVPALLPDVLKDLLQARKDVRAVLKNETDAGIKLVLNMRQLAIKVVCNTTYGFVGATAGYLPCLEIARAVTATGRWMIELCKQTIESTFPKSIIRYGDTDSVFIEFDTSHASTAEEKVREAYRLGRLATETCTKLFPRPIQLELEKVLCPTVMAGKKNYSAGKWSDPGPDNAGPCKMNAEIIVAGLRPIRRDTCDWVRKAILKSLQHILKEQDLPAALLTIRTAVRDLLANRVSWNELAITKSLAKGTDSQVRKRTLLDSTFSSEHVEEEEGSFEKTEPDENSQECEISDLTELFFVSHQEDKPIESKDQWPIDPCLLDNSLYGGVKGVHTHVARLMKYRNRPPDAGERVRFVMVDYGDAKSTPRPVSQWSEEVHVAQQHSPKCRPNVEWYCTKQLESPAVKIMALCGYDCRSFFRAVERLASQRNVALAENCFTIPVAKMNPQLLLQQMNKPAPNGKAFLKTKQSNQSCITRFFSKQ